MHFGPGSMADGLAGSEGLLWFVGCLGRTVVVNNNNNNNNKVKDTGHESFLFLRC